jgi:regulator of protease activity HflC (stomatin/prohibitin superfamily)
MIFAGKCRKIFYFLVGVQTRRYNMSLRYGTFQRDRNPTAGRHTDSHSDRHSDRHSDNHSSNDNNNGNPDDDIPDASCCCVGTTLAIMLLGSLILMALSWTTVPYWGIALQRHRMSGTWDYQHIFQPGLIYHSWKMYLVSFDRTEQCSGFLETEGDPVLVYAENGLVFKLNINYCWILQEDALGELTATYGLSFQDRITKIAAATIRDVAGQFNSTEYIRKRNTITKTIAKSLNANLSSYYVYIDEGKVALEQIDFPSALKQVNLLSVLTGINNSLQENLQQVAVIQAQTEVLVIKTLTDANFTRAQAEIEGNLSIAEAEIRGSQFVIEAQALGIQYVMNLLSFNKEETTMFIRLLALSESHVKMISGDIPLVNVL